MIQPAKEPSRRKSRVVGVATATEYRRVSDSSTDESAQTVVRDHQPRTTRSLLSRCRLI